MQSRSWWQRRPCVRGLCRGARCPGHYHPQAPPPSWVQSHGLLWKLGKQHPKATQIWGRRLLKRPRSKQGRLPEVSKAKIPISPGPRCSAKPHS